MKLKSRTLLFITLPLIIGVIIGIFATKYLPAFSPLSQEGVCQKGGYQEVRSCGGYFIAGKPCCDQGADIWNTRNQIVVSCGGFPLPPGAPESQCEKLLKNLDTKNCQELTCSPEDAKKIKSSYSLWEQTILFIRRFLSGNDASRAISTAVKVTLTPPSISPADPGILEATVIRSPTCPGAQKLGEICSAPVADETFKIIRPSDNRIIQSVRTDKDGKFAISLAVGNYTLQSSIDGVDKFGRTGGIGYVIDNPNFTITSGKTTTQQFDIDTGIR